MTERGNNREAALDSALSTALTLLDLPPSGLDDV
jgi:hypothetical protein